jgi:hypothetical protein
MNRIISVLSLIMIVLSCNQIALANCIKPLTKVTFTTLNELQFAD